MLALSTRKSICNDQSIFHEGKSNVVIFKDQFTAPYFPKIEMLYIVT